MKTRLLTFALLYISAATFAQGKAFLSNDSAREIVFSPVYMLTVDVAYAGQPIPTSPLPSGTTLYTALYAGTSAALLSLQTSYALYGSTLISPGRLAPQALVLSGVPGGVSQYFQLFVWGASCGYVPSTIASENDFRSVVNPFYFGTSGLFTAVPSATAGIWPLYQTSAPVNSTWIPGELIVYGAPEPSSLAVFSLGSGLLFLARRRR
jgi:hypothetical protein